MYFTRSFNSMFNCVGYLICILMLTSRHIFAADVSKARKNSTSVRPYLLHAVLYLKQFKYKQSICEIFNCTLHKKATYKFFDQTVANPDDGILVKNCGNKEMYFSKKKNEVAGSPKDVWKLCCELGMTPLLIETQNEIDCSNEAVMKQRKGVFKLEDNRLRFFITYYDASLKRNFESCPDQKSIPKLWAKNQPDNSDGTEGCVAISYSDSAEKLGFDDVSCAIPLYVACQITKDSIVREVTPKNLVNVSTEKTPTAITTTTTTKYQSGGVCRLSTECRVKYEKILQEADKVLRLLRQRHKNKNS